MELTPKLVQLPHDTLWVFRAKEVDDVRRKLTVASLEDVDVGAVATRSASKTRASKVGRPLGRNILLVEMLLVPPACIYTCPIPALAVEHSNQEHSPSVNHEVGDRGLHKSLSQEQLRTLMQQCS